MLVVEAHLYLCCAYALFVPYDITIIICNLWDHFDPIQLLYTVQCLVTVPSYLLCLPSDSHWWSMVLANTVHQAVAEPFFMKSKAVLNVQSQIGLPFHIGAGQFGSMVAEGPMGDSMR